MQDAKPRFVYNGSYVYVIGCPAPGVGPVKIGWTRCDPTLRLGDLRKPYDTTLVPSSVDRSRLEVLYQCDGDRALERALHLRYRRLHVIGEWFRLDPAVAPREIRMAVQEIRPVRPRVTVAHVPQVRQPEPVQIVKPDSMQVAAHLQYQQYKAWIAAGFSEDQALKLVAMISISY